MEDLALREVNDTIYRSHKLPEPVVFRTISLQHKLFAALLTFSLGVVLITYGLVSLAFETGFLRFVEARHAQEAELLNHRLRELYRQEGGWEQLLGEEQRWLLLQREIKEQAEEERQVQKRSVQPEKDGRVGDRPAKVGKFALLDSERHLLIGRDRDVARLSLSPIEVSGRIVGYIGTRLAGPLNEKTDIRFAQGLLQSFGLIAVALGLGSALLAWPLAHLFTRPLRRFTHASEQLSSGQFDARVPLDSRDEFGDLARQFNHMAEQLGDAEQRRRAWLAEVSHELRTPLSLMRAEIESMQDGVRPLDQQGLESLLRASSRLEALVGDLYQLALADSAQLQFRPQPLALRSIAERRATAFAPALAKAGLELELELGASAGEISGDPALLERLIDNLLTNALHYTRAPGQVRLRLEEDGDDCRLILEDSPPGVPEPQLAAIFERFVRLEASRSRNHGGAGLGLAICRQIARLHGGTLIAEPSPLGGLRLVLSLPRTPA